MVTQGQCLMQGHWLILIIGERKGKIFISYSGREHAGERSKSFNINSTDNGKLGSGGVWHGLIYLVWMPSGQWV